MINKIMQTYDFKQVFKNGENFFVHFIDKFGVAWYY